MYEYLVPLHDVPECYPIYKGCSSSLFNCDVWHVSDGHQDVFYMDVWNPSFSCDLDGHLFPNTNSHALCGWG